MKRHFLRHRNTLSLATLILAGIVIVLLVIAVSTRLTQTAPTALPMPTKTFGVVANPKELVNWSKKTGLNPTMPAEFEAWSKDRTLDANFEVAKKAGFRSYMITWEPWRPVPAALGLKAQSSVQPSFSNSAIAAGTQDSYIKRFALSIKNSGLETVYIRYGHEMNGTWYPWSTDSEGYKDAWRHIVDLFRELDVSNAKFVYATNPSLYQDDTSWTERFWQYYPGDSYVDYVGSTMINFGSKACLKTPCSGATKGYSVALFKERISMSYTLTGKEIIISEMNTALQQDTVQWLDDVSTYVADPASHIHGVVLSQAPSRGAAQMQTGNLSWNISDEPELYPALKKLILATTTQN